MPEASLLERTTCVRCHPVTALGLVAWQLNGNAAANAASGVSVLRRTMGCVEFRDLAKMTAPSGGCGAPRGLNAAIACACRQPFASCARVPASCGVPERWRFARSAMPEAARRAD